jgi:hypothetical protein
LPSYRHDFSGIEVDKNLESTASNTERWSC